MSADTPTPSPHKRNDNVVQRTLFHPSFYLKYFKGLTCALVGFQSAIKYKSVWKEVFKAIIPLLICLVISYLLTFIFLVFPIRAFLWIISFIWDVSAVEKHLTALHILKKLAVFIPIIGIGVIRTFRRKYNDKVFLTVLQEHNPELFKIISSVKYEFKISKYLKRLLTLYATGICILLLSFLPVVGRFVVPLAQVLYTRKSLGWAVAIALGLASLIPSLHDYSLYLLKFLMSTNTLGAEILDVYLSRLKDPQIIIYVRKRYFGTILGFSTPFMALLSIPIIGLPLWGLVQASAPAVIESILYRNSQKKDPSTKKLLGEEIFANSDLQVKWHFNSGRSSKKLSTEVGEQQKQE